MYKLLNPAIERINARAWSVEHLKISAGQDPVFRPAGFTPPPEQPQLTCGAQLRRRGFSLASLEAEHFISKML